MLLPTQDKEARLTHDEEWECFDTVMKEKAKEVGIKKRDYNDYCLQLSEDIRVWEIAHEIVNRTLVKLEKLGYHKGLPSSIEEALTSGDGTYRP